MCGIGGIVGFNRTWPGDMKRSLQGIGDLIAHRGPDDEGTWIDDAASVGFVHKRLSVIDLSPSGRQPMQGVDGSVIVFNGMIYNYRELRNELSAHWTFRSTSDTETILAAYARWGEDCLERLRGMFAFAIWDGNRLFCARDRIGIKPFYYTVVDGTFVFASEAKALLPFVPAIEVDEEALGEYFRFQFTLGTKTLFRGIHQLAPGHALHLSGAEPQTRCYWEPEYTPVLKLSDPGAYQDRLNTLVRDAVSSHLVSDVPLGTSLSGGIDSSLITVLSGGSIEHAYHGTFNEAPEYDERAFARVAAEEAGVDLSETVITAADFEAHMAGLIYHLDFPVAGPGAFAQYMVSRTAARDVKVLLSGQGGDETFGGYARYLIGYLEQCINAAIDGTYKDGNFVVSAESIIPNLGVLKEYKPMIERVWKDGFFGPLEARYFHLINRSAETEGLVDFEALDEASVYERFRETFLRDWQDKTPAYFDRMTRFDLLMFLPALLHVEDRVSMAHGVEARVPLLDHPLVEFLNTVPANIKFKDGRLKLFARETFGKILPPIVADRRDKMGFPVPLKEWASGACREFVNDHLLTMARSNRPYMDSKQIIDVGGKEKRFGRTLWGLLSLELWYQTFFDKSADYKRLSTLKI